jgi:hypothetical protein
MENTEPQNMELFGEGTEIEEVFSCAADKKKMKEVKQASWVNLERTPTFSNPLTSNSGKIASCWKSLRHRFLQENNCCCNALETIACATTTQLGMSRRPQIKARERARWFSVKS